MKDCLRYNHSELNPVHVINSLLISIVLYLHHSSYTNNYFSILTKYHINGLLQKFAIGGFFFFSGLKISISYFDYKITSFAINRFLRIYILYLVSLIIASFTLYPFLNNGLYPTINNFIFHVLCIQTIFPNYYQHNYHTLWFVSILMYCYLLFIILRNDIPNLKKFIVKLISIIVLISTVSLYTFDKTYKIFSFDFSVYLLFFSIGMLASRYTISTKNIYCFAIGLIGNILLFIIYNKIVINTWYEYLVYLSFIILSNLALFKLLCVCVKSINFTKDIKRIISYYSFASFCIFLLHRSIWSIMAYIYPKGTLLQWVYIIFLGIPIIVYCSHLMQRCFNLIIQNYTTK
jgi:peptidoglycan/LPS O-acetylase OafA/YrhL